MTGSAAASVWKEQGKCALERFKGEFIQILEEPLLILLIPLIGKAFIPLIGEAPTTKQTYNPTKVLQGFVWRSRCAQASTEHFKMQLY